MNAPPLQETDFAEEDTLPTLIQNDKNFMKLEAFSGVQDVLPSGERKSDATFFDWHVGETATDFVRAFELIGDFCDNELVDLAETFAGTGIRAR